MTASRPTLGILGGMGPYASLRFCDMLLRLSVERYGAARNADFPHFLLSSLPVPDLIANRDDEVKTVAMAEEEMRRLEAGGADFVVLACNTMHLFEARYRKILSVPFLSLIDAVINAVASDRRKRVGLLGSRTTMHSGLYVRPLERAGIDVLLPTACEETELVACIQNLVACGANDDGKKTLDSLIRSLHVRGAEAVILGCTELPLVMPKNPHVPLYDSLRILAETACEKMYTRDEWRSRA